MNQDVLKAKQDVVSEIVNKSKDSAAILVAEYHALTVAQAQELRRALRKENASMNVYKNSLVARASDELGYGDLKPLLEGPNAIFFSKDVASGAKVLAKYAKKLDGALQIKGGIVEGKFVDAKGVIEVSKLPDRNGMLAMLLSVLQAPVRQFAATVKAVADAK